MIETEASPAHRPLEDTSLYGILVGNAMTFLAAATQHWSLVPLLWVYWGQSVVIGITNVIRMLRLEEYSTAGFQPPLPPTRATLVKYTGFFALHYGGFHFVYAALLFSGKVGGRPAPADVPWIVTGILGFALAHGYSLWVNHGRDFRQKKPNLAALMFYPYLRIVPMHLAIVLGGALTGAIRPLFIGLKTVADAGMHLIERWMFQRAN